MELKWAIKLMDFKSLFRAWHIAASSLALFRVPQDRKNIIPRIEFGMCW